MSRSVRTFLGASLLALASLAPDSHADDAFVALELPEVQALALARQPLLEAGAAAVRAAREQSVAAGELPDPQLNFELRGVPVNTADAYSFTRDSDTQIMLGVMQEFPPGDSRRLRRQRASLDADAGDQDLRELRLQLRRDAALAWVDVWQSEQALALLRATEREAELQNQAAEIAYGTGTASQAELLATRVELGLIRDRSAGLQQQAAHYRNNLSRWIVDDAFRPLCPDLPDWAAPASTDGLLARLAAHPLLGAEAARVEAAGAGVALSRQSYKPGWRAGLAYGYRPEFSEMVTVQVGVDLPVFTARRQDRQLAASLAQQEQATRQRDDQWRKAVAAIRLNRADWDLLQQRLQRYHAEILPLGEQRTAAALAAWQSGRGTLAAVLDARRMALDARLQKLELQGDAARHYLNLEYLAGDLP